MTDKKKQRVQTASFRYLIPHGILILLTVASILRFLRGKYGLALVYSSVILFWLGYNLVALLYAVFFMLGRESRRISDRIGAEEKAEVWKDGEYRKGRTVDVSEEGIALRLSGMPGLKKGDTFRVVVTTEHYRAALNATCVYSRGEGALQEENVRAEAARTEDKTGSETPSGMSEMRPGVFLAAIVSPEDEESKRNWMQIIHDRKHSLPREIDPWMTVYDEVCWNIRMRWEKR